MTSVNRFTGHGLDSEQGAYKYGAERSSKKFSPSLDLFLRHDFNPSNSLEVELTGTLSSDDYRRYYTYDYDHKAPEEYVMDVDNRRRSLITEVSYVHSFSEKTSLTAGYSPTNPGYTERHIRDNGNMVALSVQYRTDFGSIFRTGRRTLNNRDQGSSLLKL